MADGGWRMAEGEGGKGENQGSEFFFSGKGMTYATHDDDNDERKKNLYKEVRYLGIMNMTQQRERKGNEGNTMKGRRGICIVCVCLLDRDRADRQTDIIESQRASRMLEDSVSFPFHT